LKVHLHHSSKIKSYKKKSQNSRKQGFSSVFCLLMEGSGSGTVQINYGSGCGSRRPKNIRLLQNRMPIWIRNTTYFRNKFSTFSSACWPWSGLGSGMLDFESADPDPYPEQLFQQFYLACRNQCGEAYATTTLTVKRRKDDYRSVLKHNVKREYIPQSRGSLATSE
jgi:hypothetical protein